MNHLKIVSLLLDVPVHFVSYADEYGFYQINQFDEYSTQIDFARYTAGDVLFNNVCVKEVSWELVLQSSGLKNTCKNKAFYSVSSNVTVELQPKMREGGDRGHLLAEFLKNYVVYTPDFFNISNGKNVCKQATEANCGGGNRHGQLQWEQALEWLLKRGCTVYYKIRQFNIGDKMIGREMVMVPITYANGIRAEAYRVFVPNVNLELNFQKDYMALNELFRELKMEESKHGKT